MGREDQHIHRGLLGLHRAHVESGIHRGGQAGHPPVGGARSHGGLGVLHSGAPVQLRAGPTVCMHGTGQGGSSVAFRSSFRGRVLPVMSSASVPRAWVQSTSWISSRIYSRGRADLLAGQGWGS